MDGGMRYSRNELFDHRADVMVDRDLLERWPYDVMAAIAYLDAVVLRAEMDLACDAMRYTLASKHLPKVQEGHIAPMVDLVVERQDGQFKAARFGERWRMVA